jgi:hypothetical protein
LGPVHLKLEWPENLIETSSGHDRSFRMDSPLADGQVAFDELTGKALSRVRHCPEDPYGDLFEGTGHFCEFHSQTVRSFASIPIQSFSPQHIRADREGDLLGEVND